MKISRAHIRGYRNLKNIDIEFNRLVIFIGENNGGKSNLLRAITLPFTNDEIGYVNKTLGWNDINNYSKNRYFEFIEENFERIQKSEVKIEEIKAILPFVSVNVVLNPERDIDEYYLRKWNNSLEKDKSYYSIEYRYEIENPKELLDYLKDILTEMNKDSIKDIKMNLLPIDLFKYSIINPCTNEKISYNDLISLNYNSLAAERDDFSNKHTTLGSTALVNLLNNKLTSDQKIKVEKSYDSFFEDLKGISNLEDIFNWQENSVLKNAEDFFDQITLLPNMPSMNSLLNNVRLGFGEDYLNSQGLGYRNLVYLLVIINSLEINKESALNILTLEEPEAHLCFNNEKLLASFINSMVNNSVKTQIFISTHSSEFLNKLELSNVTVVSDGSAFSLKTEIEQKELDYLAKKPNLDFLKFLFSKNCILVEGPTEELLIKSYLNLQDNLLNDIEVISLHKGFTKMLDIWLKVNEGTNHRIGIIRDFDNQPKAQENHEKYNEHNNLLVTTTGEYTLEPEMVNTGDNFKKLKKYFEDIHGWKDKDIQTKEALSDKWQNAKTDTMLKFCQDFGQAELKDVELPGHIDKVLKFLYSGDKK